MSLNQTLLALLKTRAEFNKLDSNIHLDRFDKEERVLIKQIRRYWKQYDHDVINFELFSQDFFNELQCNADECSFYRRVFKKMQQDPDPEIAKGIVRSLRTMEFIKKIEEVQTVYHSGGDIDVYEEIRDTVQDFAVDIRKDASDDYCKATVQELVEDNEKGIRFEWKLKALQNSMPGIRTGNQIIVAMRPGLGKTSFVADNCIHWLRSDFIQSTGRPVVWFNNEGQMLRIKGNFLRAALGKDFKEISALGWEEADRQFLDVIGSNDNLRIYDIHGRDYKYLERLIEKDNPAVVVFDMLDNVRGFSNTDRKDQQLESLYQWARESAVKYNFLSVPTSQVSVEGDGMRWVPDSCLKDSKTGKQGACDAIITIGSDSKVGFEYSRFIYIPKRFKGSPKEGFSPTCQQEVIFDPASSRFMDASIK